MAGVNTRVAPNLYFVTADPFAEAVDKEESGAGKDYVHIRIQQRNGKKSLTTIQVCSSFLRIRGPCKSRLLT